MAVQNTPEDKGTIHIPSKPKSLMHLSVAICGGSRRPSNSNRSHQFRPKQLAGTGSYAASEANIDKIEHPNTRYSWGYLIVAICGGTGRPFSIAPVSSGLNSLLVLSNVECRTVQLPTRQIAIKMVSSMPCIFAVTKANTRFKHHPKR